MQTKGGAEPVPGLKVSEGFFRTLGVQPVLGRDFHPGEDAVSVPATALLSYSATMALRIRDSYTAWLHRSAAYLVGEFAALALMLGVVGLYGVISYSVSQRTREIGVRMALGAQRQTVHWMVLREATRLMGTGLAAGLVCSIGAAALMRSLLFGATAWDVPTLTAVSALLGSFALLASFLPARRAARMNPVEALRAE